MLAVRVIVDVGGRRLEPMLQPESFDVDGNTASALFDCFPFDPSAVDHIEVINGVRWVATSAHVEFRNDRRCARLFLTKIAEVG